MSTELSRRVLLHGGAIAAPVGAAAVALSRAGASGPPTAASFGLVGTWSATITIPSDPSIPAEPGLFAFGADGLVSGVSDGNVAGFGTWQPTGHNTFAIDFRHFITDSSGAITGTVRVTQQGVLNSPAQFTADGPAEVYDLNGTLEGSNESHTVAARYGFSLSVNRERMILVLRFNVLGPLEMYDGRQLRTPRAHKIRVLLAVFLVHRNQTVSIETLIYQLWGEIPPRTALKALRVYISQLREAIRMGDCDDRDRPVLVTTAPGYCFQPQGAAIDIDEFERLCRQGALARERGSLELAAQCYREALEVWRGGALADVRSAPMLNTTAVRLEEVRFAALERRIDLDIQLGRFAEIIPELYALTAEFPMREGICAQLMTALSLAGRTCDAVSAYHALRRRLVDELGVEPGKRLGLLYTAIIAEEEPPLRQWEAFANAGLDVSD